MLITGATGLVGKALVAKIGNATVLARDPARARRELGTVEAHAWEANAGPPPREAVRDAEVVFNLAGEPVMGGRWTRGRKRRLIDSRVAGTRHLVAAIGAL
ncbi:MAG TPA: NAD-dependent epimerase/dehydratase family protein, partial [Polyangiaceae bacterium]|nr:NAD-dependent epimerase/dehydratase family protein [Polyangiaceae bacterium]